ncbi:MAG: ABC transporter ATP-binding protein [Erysipelotrichaceae bacterium]|nr:ABC transporter ATP-binding protein [Erysipelotrichaceae bacterium]
MFKVYKKLLSYVPKQKWLAYVSFFITTISALLIAFGYYYMYHFLKQLIVFKEYQHALNNAILIVCLLFSGSILYIVAVLITHLLGFRLETNLRKKGIEGLMNASFKFFDLNPSGRVRKIIDDNAAQTHTIIAHLIPDNSNALISPLLFIGIGFIVDIKVGIAIIIFTVVAIISIMGMVGNKEFMSIYQMALEKLSNETVEYVRGMPVVKIFKSDVNSFKSLHQAITDYSTHSLKYSMSCRNAYVFYQLIFLSALAILLPFIVLFMDMSVNPEILAVNLIMFTFLTGLLFSSFMRIMYLSMYSFMGMQAVEKLEQIFDEMHQDAIEFGNDQELNGSDIEFKHVNFGYGKDLVIKDLSFKLAANKTYAFVGASGGGKSTIAKLISGLYKIDSGEILIGGKNITSLNEETLTRNIAFVFQDSKLFKMSIFDNVKLGNKNATDEEVMQALHLAGCDELLAKLPQREDTLIGSKGIYLSGGEKQRIAIARAILKDAKIIIMDEASAAIDPENEHELQKAFKNLIKHKTVIMVAHRLSSIASVDEIMVIEKGEIIERGNEQTLLASASKYQYFKELYNQANDWRLCDEK